MREQVVVNWTIIGLGEDNKPFRQTSKSGIFSKHQAKRGF
jgi:hypothetical protein